MNNFSIAKFCQAFIIILTIIASLSLGTFNSAAAQDSVPAACSRIWYDANWVAASALGIEDFELADAVANGQTIAQIATNRNVNVQLVINALVDAESNIVNRWEQSGCLTVEEANTWIHGLPAKMHQFVGAASSVNPARQQTDNVVFLPLLMN